MKSLTDPDGGFFSRRGLSHTRLAFQKEYPSAALGLFLFFLLFTFMASSPAFARLVGVALSALTFSVFMYRSFQSVRNVLRAYRRDVEERKAKIVREVMES